MKNTLSMISMIILLLFIASPLFAQLNLSVTQQPNHYCNGCSYSGSSILINEVMISPMSGDGSIYGLNPDQRGEWIELYNPDSCCPRDISCYFLGNNASDQNPSLDFPGGFEIPQGTIIPPAGFVIVRGLNAPAVPSNLLVQNGGKTIEYVVGSDNQCCYGSGERLWFPNAGGWFAFYDANGVPQDAIYWNDSLNFEHFTNPCDPAEGCELTSLLAPFGLIPQNIKSYIAAGGPIADHSFKRVPDGGPWQVDIAYVPTYGDCNVQPCPIVNPCNGTATVSVNGGTPPYQFLWDDCRHQTDPTVVGLCAGTYCVTVTDIEGSTATICVTIVNNSPVVELDPIGPFCQYGDSVRLTQGTPADGYYTGNGVENGYLYPSEAGPGEHVVYYIIDNGVGCYGEDSVSVVVWPAPRPIADAYPDSLCAGSNTHLIANAASGSGNGYQYHWEGPVNFASSGADIIIHDIQTFQGGSYLLMVTDSRNCGSIIPDTLLLTVFTPPGYKLFDTDTLYLCEGESYALQLTPSDTISYLWDDGSTGNQYIVHGEGRYIVQASYRYCTDADTIYFLPCTDLWVPNAFTPNRDNNNDIFMPKCSQSLSEFQLLIYNRWGQLLFTSNDILRGWDGRYRDQDCKADVYVYTITWTPKEGGRQLRQGMVVLVR
ncbi:MAG: gliding motility-associated C-terminal domain-containing protein [Bacteroidales bacterium]